MICIAGRALAAGPAQAYLRAGEHGQALLMSRLGECYAVTPKHVIADELFATLVGGSPGAPQGDGDLLQTFGYDLSILRASGELTRQCGGALTAVPALGQLLATADSGVVTSVNGDGSISRRSVTLTDVGLIYLRLRPRSMDDQLFKGLSGSLVLADQQPIGILMSVDPETGEGRALRYDRAIEILRPFFGLPASVVREEEKSTVDTGSGSNMAGEVVEWSAPPLSAEYRAANLVDPRETETIWLVRPEGFPIELVVALPGDKAHVVSALRLVGNGVEPKTRLPRDFEILVSNADTGGWIPVRSGSYFKNEADKLVEFAPVRARRIMLRIYSHWGDTEAIGLSGIEIPALQ
ncbi:hypothetical protein D6C00_10590 [Thiohalobacter thiocyanaticus]|uniref:Discoidin domain-containing protein n=2 Tax=Thiohalobacter thiocyanaticus TaxID=585455 RepID=A0A426QKR7_9GAMM|nr:hypothetical protein D6C00_10590 [Thiohalobacter thiocyanaticus]